MWKYRVNETEKGYPKLGKHQDDNTKLENYAFLYTECDNLMYVENRMYRFLDNNAICPKCGRLIQLQKG